jgi:hypothetical protein
MLIYWPEGDLGFNCNGLRASRDIGNSWLQTMEEIVENLIYLPIYLIR